MKEAELKLLTQQFQQQDTITHPPESIVYAKLINISSNVSIISYYCNLHELVLDKATY
jgi:hypothetical protein